MLPMNEGTLKSKQVCINLFVVRYCLPVATIDAPVGNKPQQTKCDIFGPKEVGQSKRLAVTPEKSGYNGSTGKLLNRLRKIMMEKFFHKLRMTSGFAGPLERVIPRTYSPLGG